MKSTLIDRIELPNYAAQRMSHDIFLARGVRRNSFRNHVGCMERSGGVIYAFKLARKEMPATLMMLGKFASGDAGLLRHGFEACRTTKNRIPKKSCDQLRAKPVKHLLILTGMIF